MSTKTHSRLFYLSIFNSTVLSYALVNALIKSASSQIEVYLLAAVISLFAVTPYLLVFILRRNLFYINNVRILFVFAIVALIGFLGNIYALKGLSLAVVTILIMTSQLITPILGVIFLGQKLTRTQWVSVFICFLGVVMVVQPHQTGVNWWAFLAGFLAALSYSIENVLMNKVGEGESAFAIAAFENLGILIVAGIIAFYKLDTLAFSTSHIWVVVVIGLLTGFADMFYMFCYSKVEARILNPFGYFAIIWAIVLDYLGWKVLPDFLTLLGIGTILAGIYIYSRGALK